MQQQLSKEELEALQEKIKNMSPEELKEFQKKQCIFCQIIAGKIQSRRVYEDDKCIAILDINPANPGHILLLPKEHYSIMPQIPEDEVSHLFVVVKTLSNAILKALDAKGTNIIIANGIAAGQKAQHFMVHIIPRKKKDGIRFEIPQNKQSEDELEEVRKGLCSSLGTRNKPGREDQLSKVQKILQSKKDKQEKTDKSKEKSTKKTKKKQGAESKESLDVSLDDITKIIDLK